MKLTLNKFSKGFLIFLLVILIIVAGGGGILHYTKPVIDRQEKQSYQCKITPEVNYQVYLVDNNLYPTNPLEEDKNYLTNLIKHIQATFKLNLKGTSEATLKGNYEIFAEVRGYAEKNQIKEIIWSKEFPLVEKQNFEVTGQELSEGQEVYINFNGYNQFAKTVIETTKVNLPTELVVTMKGQMNIETAGKVVEESILTSLVIPLDNQYFAITKEGVESRENAITETIEVVVPVSIKDLVPYGIVIGGCMIALIVLIGFTKPPTPQDIKRKQVKKLFNAHGSRMVAVDSINITSYSEVYRVTNLEDLIKIADELEKPVLYEENVDMLKITKFHVMDKETVYIYEIKEDLHKERFEVISDQINETIE